MGSTSQKLAAFVSTCAVTMALAGCANGQQPSRQETQASPRTQSIGWVKQDWRICEDDTCPKPTPKTLGLAIPMAVATRPAVSVEMPIERREPIVVHFGFDKTVPVGDWKRALESVERKAAPSDRLLIESYTDDKGSARYNDRLARQRAEFVRSWLKARGVKNPMEVVVKGKCCYVAPNDTEAGRAANRRAEIHFITPKEINK